MQVEKYHLHDIVSTTPYPHVAYWQRLGPGDKIIVAEGAIVGFRTGVQRNKLTAKADAYYIHGVLVRRPLKQRNTWSAHMYFYPLRQLSKESLEIFSS